MDAIKLTYTILVSAAPLSKPGNQSALNFCQALIAKKHAINSVFFYQEGVLTANKFIDFTSNEAHPSKAWQQLARDYNINLAVCIGASARRGIVTAIRANEFKAVGLGHLMEAMRTSDRIIQFH